MTSRVNSKPKLRRKASVERVCETASQRLVEYFVVVSCHPRWENRPAPQKVKKDPKEEPQAELKCVSCSQDTTCDDEQRDDEFEEARSSSTSTEGNIHLRQDQAEHTFQPKMTARYPLTDYPDHPLNPMIVQFCHPNTDVICLSTEYHMPRIHHFVLTNDKGRKVYGTCLTVYEEYRPPEGSPIHQDTVHTSALSGDIEVTPDTSGQTLYLPKVLCLLSTWPYLTAFREYLTQLYRLATTTNLMEAPIERHVTNICREIPAPPPGSFEIQVSILNSRIRFWAPPAKLPIAYVALPFQTLFDCLDLDNILQVWYALTLERKVLLLSSQYSILSVCCEIFCSLLFPMQWSHLYIPLLPHFLSPMLDAPVPYLVGVSRDHWYAAQQYLNEETIVVDLDRNQVTIGEGTESLPPMPGKKYAKLWASLEISAGDLFWKTRGIDHERRLSSKKHSNAAEWKSAQAKGEERWSEKLRNFDEAIHLAYTPESPNLLNDASRDRQPSQWDRVQESFLSFFVSVFKDYRKFVVDEDPSRKSSNSRWSKTQSFDRERFISSQKNAYRPFLNELCMTQQFDDFVTKRIYSPGEPDVIFFDQSIDAKLNRSKLKIRKKETPFLHSARIHKVLKVESAIAPSSDGLSDQGTPYIYEQWPATFDHSMFYRPRSIPGMITAEFDRQSALVLSLTTKEPSEDTVCDDGGDLYVGDFDSSPEVATFTLFFMTYSAVIGRDWQKFVMKSLAMNENGLETNVNDPEYQEALAVAAAQLDLAFNVLTMLRIRLLAIDPEAIKCLMEACGRCGDSKRALELMEIIKSEGLIVDSEMYSSFLSSYAIGEAADFESPGHMSGPRRGSDAYSAFLKRKWESARRAPKIEPSWMQGAPGSDELTSVSETSSECSNSVAPDSNCGLFGDCYNVLSLAFEGFKPTPPKMQRKKARKTRRHRRKKSALFEDIIVTEKVKKQLSLGENLLDFLYPDLEIDTKSDACPQCSRVLTEAEIVSGWHPRQFTDFTTGCPVCKHRFVPRVVVKCSNPSFEGSQGRGTPLYCEFLSPWVLIKELKQEVDSGDAVEEMLDPEWRRAATINATLWWNLAISFIRYRLPLSFLLQGSFQNRLINPDPEA